MERPQRLPALQEPGGELMAARSLLRLALALLLACAGLPVSAQLPTHGVNTRALLLAGDFAALERLYQTESAAAPVARRIGVELAPFYFYFSLELGVTPANWPQDDKATRAWLERFPASVPAAIARADALGRRAATLDRAGDWPGVETVLREQEKLLLAVQPRAARDMTWHVLYVGYGRQQGWPAARLRTAIEAALDVDPISLSFYHTAGRALAPEWRGSAEPLEWLARQGAARTAPDGAVTYTLVRLRTAEFIEAVLSRPFEAGMMDWALVNQGMVEHYRRNPNGFTLNEHAALACRARDKATTAALIARIGTGVSEGPWKRWGGVAHYENCRRWAEAGALKS